MKKIKVIFALIMTVAVAGCFSACGEKEEKAEASSRSAAQQSATQTQQASSAATASSQSGTEGGNAFGSAAGGEAGAGTVLDSEKQNGNRAKRLRPLPKVPTVRRHRQAAHLKPAAKQAKTTARKPQSRMLPVRCRHLTRRERRIMRR